MLRLQGSHRVAGQRGHRRHLREGPPVGPVEANTPAGAATDYLPPPRVPAPTSTSASLPSSSFIPPSLIPPSLIPPSLIPSSFFPSSFFPSSFFPSSLIPPSFIPSSLFPSSSFPSFFRVRHDLDPEALFVHCPVMTPTQQDQVVEPCLSAVGPVLDVMRVTETQPAAREAAPSVPVVERPADGGWNGPGFSAHIEHRTVRSVGHDDEARVTSDAPRRSRGNA